DREAEPGQQRRGRPARGQRGHDGGAEGDADLLAHGDQPGGPSLLLARDARGGRHGVADDRDEVRDAAGEGDDQQRYEPAAAVTGEGEGKGGGGLDDEPGDDRGLRADPADDPRCDQAAEDGPGPEDGEDEPGGHRGVAEDLLQIEGQQEHQRSLGREGQQPGDVAPGDVAPFEQGRRDEGFRDPGLDAPEDREQDDRRQDRPPGPDAGPAAVAGGVDAEHEGGQGQGDGDRAEGVELRSASGGWLAQHERGDGEHGGGDDDVDEERPPPAH